MWRLPLRPTSAACGEPGVAGRVASPPLSHSHSGTRRQPGRATGTPQQQQMTRETPHLAGDHVFLYQATPSAAECVGLYISKRLHFR